VETKKVFDGCSDDLEIIYVKGPTWTIVDGELRSVQLNGVTDIKIPNSVTNIGYGVFDQCTTLKSVEIPDSVISIESNAFYGCSSLSEIVIPDSVTRISPSAFDKTPIGDKAYADMFKSAVKNLSSSGVSMKVPKSVALTVTNVVIHYVTQSLSSDAVIPSTSAGIVNVITEVNSGSAIAITSEWATQYEGFEAKFGSDFTAAITAATGKFDGVGKPMMVWQDYVAGTDPTDPTDTFQASITFDKKTNGCRYLESRKTR
jgi:hypothetical protein